MAKHLSVILKNYSDVISGKLPASEVTALKTGDNPGVDYAGKMPDEREFVASHSVEKHPDRNGNGDDLFNAANIKNTDSTRHGHIPKPKDIKVYKQANEEFDLDEKYSGFEKTKKSLAAKGAKDPEGLAAWIGRKKYGKEKFQKAAAEGKKLKEAKDEGEYGYEGDMAISQLKSLMRNANQLLGMLKPDTDLPEWVQSKITLAEDYITTAANYMTSEMSEETDKSLKDAFKEATMCENCGKSSCSCDSDEEMPKGKAKGKKLLLGAKKSIQEKAESVAQQKLMGMALAHKRGEMPEASEEVKKLASSMSEKQLKDFAKTKHEGLPQKVQKESAPASTPITFPVTNSREGFKL